MLALTVPGVGMGAGDGGGGGASVYVPPVRRRIGVVHTAGPTIGGPGVSMWGWLRGLSFG